MLLIVSNVRQTWSNWNRTVTNGRNGFPWVKGFSCRFATSHFASSFLEGSVVSFPFLLPKDCCSKGAFKTPEIMKMAAFFYQKLDTDCLTLFSKENNNHWTTQKSWHIICVRQMKNLGWKPGTFNLVNLQQTYFSHSLPLFQASLCSTILRGLSGFF